MQGVAELVEHGQHVVHCLQGRTSLLGGQCHVAHVGDDGLHAHGTIVRLRTETTAPCTGTLAVAGIVVAIENGNEVAFLVYHVPTLLLLVVLGIVLGALTEGKAVEFVGRPEYALNDVVDFQILANLGLADVELLLLGLVQIVHVIPRFGLALDAVLAHHHADVVQFSLGGLHGRFPNLVEQVVDVLRLLGHTSLQLHVGKGLVAHQVGHFQSQGHDLCRDGLVVVLVGMVATVVVHLVHAAAQVAVLGILEHGIATGALHVETVLALGTRALGQSGGLLYVRFGKSLQFLCVGYGNVTVVSVVHQVLGELKLQLGQLLVNLRTALLLGIVQHGTATHETLVGLLQQALLLGVKVQFVLPVIYGLHTEEKSLVHVHVVAMC